MLEKTFEEKFAHRLNELRTHKGVSARDMSLSIGQNAGYINYIENGKSLPSMSGFFFICEYLEITPGEFFDERSENPEALRCLTENLKKLTSDQLHCISRIVEDLAK